MTAPLYNLYNDAQVDVRGDLLTLHGTAYAQYLTDTPVTPRLGWIHCWVHPDSLPTRSRVLVTRRWSIANYMALSSGWWENKVPSEQPLLYLIVMNSPLLYCVADAHDSQLPVGRYTCIDAFWSVSDDGRGRCALFKNGRWIAGRTLEKLEVPAIEDGLLHVGTELPTPVEGRRGCDATLMLDVRAEVPTEAEILARFTREAPHCDVTGQEWQLPSLAKAKTPVVFGGEVHQARAIMDEDIHWTDPTKVDAILDRVVQANLNTYIACVWHGGGTYFPYYQWHDPRLNDMIARGYDPLKVLIEKATARGIQVLAWVCLGKREWDHAAFRDYWDAGTPAGFYNLHHPGFRKATRAMCVFLVKEYYGIGLCLDYVRTGGVPTSEMCRIDYERRTGRNFISDYAKRDVPGAARDALQGWNDNAVGELVRQIASDAVSINRNCVVMTCGQMLPAGQTRALQGRDDHTWAKRRWVDLVGRMDYRPAPDLNTVKQCNAEVERQAVTPILCTYDNVDGIHVARDPAVLVSLVDVVERELPGLPVILYIWAFLTEAQALALAAGPFREKARPHWPYGMPTFELMVRDEE